MDDTGAANASPAGFAARLTGWARQGLAGAAQAPASLARRALSLVYPPSCVACQSGVAEPHGLCADCWSRMSFITPPLCERLGTPFAIDLGGRLISPQAMADPPVFARARAVSGYDEVARELIHRLKYGDRLELARAMGGMMLLAGRELSAEADIVVPVPLHRVRLWQRRFNQAAALAAVVARGAGLPMRADLLKRVKATRPQIGLSRNERAENLQGALRAAAGARPYLEGRRVLLVDDVLTTGATANAAARALLRAGATAVDLLTFARVIPGRG